MARGFSWLRSTISKFLTITCRHQTLRKLQRKHKNVYAIVSEDFPVYDLSKYKRFWEIAQRQTKFRWLVSSHFIDKPSHRSLVFISDMDPPESVRGMTVLDRDMFKKTVKIPGLKIPVRKVGILKKNLKAVMLKVPKIKPIADLADDDPDKKTHKLFLFSPEKYATYQDLDESDRKMLQENDINCTDLEMFTVDMTYDNWNAQEVVRAVLPIATENVSGFSTIGHIAHLNLRSEAFPYKTLIGEVIIDKIPGIRTVVNKLDVIDSTFRNFKMELLSGEDNYITQSRENGCVYEFDFSKVYWNPRLGTEHARIIDELERGDIVYDMFAGVGPFAIPAGKRGIIVHANDLNPDSFASLQKNISLNKIKTGTVSAYNMDAREFVQKVVKSDLMKRLKTDDSYAGNLHILMNLPASAIEFLDCFVSLLTDSDLSDVDETKLPIVHCYSFSKSNDPCKDVQEQGEVILGHPITTDLDVRFVRNVAPNKEMMCLSFRLTKDVLFQEVKENDAALNGPTEEEPDAKRMKTV